MGLCSIRLRSAADVASLLAIALMSTYRFIRSTINGSLEQVPASLGIAAAAAADSVIGIEAFRTIRFQDLPAEVIQQLRSDGTHGGPPRSLDGAQQVFDHNMPMEAHGSVQGVEAITNDPGVHWMHLQPHASGGGSEAANGVYGPADLNQAIGSRPMTPAEVQQAQAHSHQLAETATPGVTGDLGEVIGDGLRIGAWGGVMGAAVSTAHRLAQAQGYRDAGRHNLAAASQAQLLSDAGRGAINGVLRGGSVALTQAVLGANPITAGIGLVAPDAIRLLTHKDSLSPEAYRQQAIGVVGKGALATALVISGPIGCMAVMGFSIASAYGKASEEASTTAQQGT